jgi:hypothetical protein
MEHDPNAARATFVELAFGINVLWAAFDKFSAIFSNSFSKKMEERIASVQALESKSRNSETRLTALKKKVATANEHQRNSQRVTLNVAKILSVSAALACLPVVYFDLLDLLGKKLGYLVLPLPSYLVVSFLIYLVARIRIWWMMRGYANFVRDFEGNPAEIEQKLNAFNPSAAAETLDPPQASSDDPNRLKKPEGPHPTPLASSDQANALSKQLAPSPETIPPPLASLARSSICPRHSARRIVQDCSSLLSSSTNFSAGLAAIRRLQASWNHDAQQVTVVFNDTIVLHLDPQMEGASVTSFFVDRRSGSSIYPAMKSQGTGLRVLQISGFPNRFTAIAFAQFASPSCMIVAEAHFSANMAPDLPPQLQDKELAVIKLLAPLSSPPLISKAVADALRIHPLEADKILETLETRGLLSCSFAIGSPCSFTLTTAGRTYLTQLGLFRQ